MEVLATLIELCCSKSQPDEETAILRERIREKATHCHSDELHTLTANATLFNHKYSGPSTYESLVRTYAKKSEYRSFRPILKLLSKLHMDHRLGQYEYTVITMNNVCICLKTSSATTQNPPPSHFTTAMSFFHSPRPLNCKRSARNAATISESLMSRSTNSNTAGDTLLLKTTLSAQSCG